MIFLTVGTQLPFDRLVQIVDAFALSNNADVIAQVGSSAYKCRHVKAVSFLTPDEVDEYFSKCSVIVSHAGMGSIINALRIKKPLIIFPRKACFGEHRNDHQLDTIKSFSSIEGIYPALDDNSLLEHLRNYSSLASPTGLSNKNAVLFSQVIKDKYLK